VSRGFSFRFQSAFAAFFFVLALGGVSAQAADKVLTMPVDLALATPEAKAALDGSVAFYFGDTAHPKVVQSFGEFVSNKKTNAFAKSDEATCQHVVLSNFIALQERAKQLGGDAVVNIRSYFRSNEVKSDTQYECHVGFLMSGVALKGEVVKLAD
jgi:uncharacterized protein YbjQ (UPF0145 family)